MRRLASIVIVMVFLASLLLFTGTRFGWPWLHSKAAGGTVRSLQAALDPEDITTAVVLREAGIHYNSTKLDDAATALRHPDSRMRRVAALALGRMGTPRAEDLLLSAQRKAKKGDLALPAIQVGLALARSSRLQGLERVRQFHSELRIDPSEFTRPSKQQDTMKTRPDDLPPNVRGLAAGVLVEIVAEEKAKGRDVRSLAAALVVDGPGAMRLRLADKSQAYRMAEIIDYLSALKVCRYEDHDIAQMLADEGSPAVVAVVKHIRSVVSRRDGFTRGDILLLRVLGNIGDRSAEPLLAELAANPDKAVAQEARMNLSLLRQQLRAPLATFE